MEGEGIKYEKKKKHKHHHDKKHHSRYKKHEDVLQRKMSGWYKNIIKVVIICKYVRKICTILLNKIL